MAAERLTPRDKVSGLPLPIVPDGRFLPLDNAEVANWHHHFHPRKLLLHEQGNLALRNCRIQLVSTELHTEYHKHFLGPRLPKSTEQIFGAVVLACAGYVPSKGIDLSAGEPKIIKLTQEQKQELRRWDNFDYREFRYAYEPIREFLTDYTLEQDFKDNGLDVDVVDEFLNSSDEEVRRHLGHQILFLAVDNVSSQVFDKYRMARKAKLLHPKMPGSPRTLVKYKLGSEQRREQIFPQLETILRQQFDGNDGSVPLLT